jgi:hypothetical protein
MDDPFKEAYMLVRFGDEITTQKINRDWIAVGLRKHLRESAQASEDILLRLLDTSREARGCSAEHCLPLAA